MRQQMRTGIGFYLLILVIIAAAVYVSGTLDQGGQKTYNIVNFTTKLQPVFHVPPRLSVLSVSFFFLYIIRKSIPKNLSFSNDFHPITSFLFYYFKQYKTNLKIYFYFL